MIKRIKNIGPGTIIAAAFIGPGTITVCTLVGIQHRFTLLWAIIISMLATIILQEMSARFGLISKMGITKGISKTIQQPFFRGIALLLILTAILLGNAAYEAGNISGGVLGLQNVINIPSINIGHNTLQLSPIIIGLIAFLLLYFGGYKTIEKTLIGIVLIMSALFLLAAILTLPNVIEIAKGLFIPTVPESDWYSVLTIVGTTVVPYNIFLHASLVQEKWKGNSDLKPMRFDTYFAVILGGLVSISIIISAAGVDQNTVNGAQDLAFGLEPLLGSFAPYCIGIGLFAAGISSAITAPMAAGYVVRDLTDNKKLFHWTWMIVLFTGVCIASINFKPIHIIQIAQFANGLLLPIITVFLIYVCNQKQILGKYSNNPLQNLFAISILLLTIFLGTKSILNVLNIEW